MGKKVSARAVISGRVQGVFFRMEAKRAAAKLGLSGWVKNNSDGSVEALFEGEKSQVATILEWCWHGSPLAEVDNVEVDWGEFTGRFTCFEITY